MGATWVKYRGWTCTCSTTPLNPRTPPHDPPPLFPRLPDSPSSSPNPTASLTPPPSPHPSLTPPLPIPPPTPPPPLQESCEEYLQQSKVKELVERYSEFINFPIYLHTEKTVGGLAPPAGFAWGGGLCRLCEEFINFPIFDIIALFWVGCPGTTAWS